VGLGIELGQLHLGLQVARGLGKGRRHLQARAAPGGPEIHHHRQVAAADVLVERGRIQRHGRSGKQGLVATAAVWGLPQVRAPDPVGGVAVGADDVG